jgi:hypothetical protein
MIIESGVVERIFEEPGPWYYATLNGNKNYLEVSDWCLDNFGIDGMHNWITSVDKRSYFFNKEDDLILFVLRWS